MFSLWGFGGGFFVFIFFSFPSLNNRKQTRLPGALGRPRRGGRCRLRSGVQGALRGVRDCARTAEPLGPIPPSLAALQASLSAKESTKPPGYGPFTDFPQLSPSFSQLREGGRAISSRLERLLSPRAVPPSQTIPTARSGCRVTCKAQLPPLCVSPLLKLCKEVWYLIKES